MQNSRSRKDAEEQIAQRRKLMQKSTFSKNREGFTSKTIFDFYVFEFTHALFVPCVFA
jgi:hypothetical protein